MESFPEEEKAPISNDSQEPFLFDIPQDPQELTESHYEALDKRYGGMIDGYAREDKIRDGALQGALWIELCKRTGGEISQGVLEAYLRNKRNLKLSSYSQNAPWFTSKVVRSPNVNKSPNKNSAKKTSTLRTSSKPPSLSEKAKGGNDDSFDEDRPVVW